MVIDAFASVQLLNGYKGDDLVANNKKRVAIKKQRKINNSVLIKNNSSFLIDTCICLYNKCYWYLPSNQK